MIETIKLENIMDDIMMEHSNISVAEEISEAEEDFLCEMFGW